MAVAKDELELTMDGVCQLGKLATEIKSAWGIAGCKTYQ
jgi:hypothetical protein